MNFTICYHLYMMSHLQEVYLFNLKTNLKLFINKGVHRYSRGFFSEFQLVESECFIKTYYKLILCIFLVISGLPQKVETIETETANSKGRLYFDTKCFVSTFVNLIFNDKVFYVKIVALSCPMNCDNVFNSNLTLLKVS